MGFHNFTNNTDGRDDNNGNPPNNNNGSMSFSFNIPQMPGDTDNEEDMSQYMINYNEKFKNSGDILFRDKIVQQTISVLIGMNKPNVLLVGAAGTGKTKIVENIAYRIANNDPLIPDGLKNSVIYEVPLSGLMAGTMFRGELENRVKNIVEFMSDPDNNAIMFIDEIHVLFNGSESYNTIAQFLKPALARGDIKLIGATTLQESKNISSDPAFERRMSRVIVDELTRDQTIEILKNVKTSMLAHYKNKLLIDDSTIESIVAIADQYSTSKLHRPDNAITLFDRAMSDALVERKVLEIKAKNDPTLLQAIQAVPLIPVKEKQIKATAISLMTGNSKAYEFDIDKLRAALSVIKGQDDVLAEITDKLRRREMSLFPKTKPLTWLFAGTSGVGKTEVTKIIAREVTDTKPIILNMAEYHGAESINRIIGAPAGYVGYDSNAELPFDILESNPYQIILLDEFEKSNKAVQRLFMNVFEEGVLETNRGRVLDFSKAIIIATTNAGGKEIKQSLGFTKNETSKSSSQSLNKELASWFDNELLNKFTKIFKFNSLSKDIYREIVAEEYARQIARIKADRRRITLPDEMPDDDLDKIVEETYYPNFGARPAGKAVQDYIETNAI